MGCIKCAQLQFNNIINIYFIFMPTMFPSLLPICVPELLVRNLFSWTWNVTSYPLGRAEGPSTKIWHLFLHNHYPYRNFFNKCFELGTTLWVLALTGCLGHSHLNITKKKLEFRFSQKWSVYLDIQFYNLRIWNGFEIYLQLNWYVLHCVEIGHP